MEGMTLERLQVIIEAYTQPYQDELDRVRQRTSSVTSHVEKQTGKISRSFGKIAGIVGAALSVAAIVSFGKSCIQLGSDLAEVQNVVDVTFGDMSRQVDAFSKSAIAQFGLSELTAKKYMGTYGAMSKAVGFDPEQAYAMSKAVTELTGDVASFYNLSTDEAYDKLKSIWSGETETLRSIGVVMTQAALDQYALANGYGKTTSKMSEQEKVMLRYKFVMNSLSDASGDFQRTSLGWANSTRVLALQFESLKATIGQGLINAFTPVIQVINTILAKLQTLANYFKALTQALFGHAGGSGSNQIVKTANAMGRAARSSGAIADNMGRAADNAKAARDYTLGIDELNVLSPEDSSSGGSGGGTGGGDGGGGEVPDFGDMSGELFGEVTVNPEIEAAVERMKQAIENLKDAAKPTLDAIKKLWDEGLSILGTFVWESLNDFYTDFLVPIGKWALGEGLPRFLEIINSFLKAVNWEAIRSALDNLWKALEPFAENIGNGLLDFFEDLSGFGADFINAVVPGGLNALADALDKIDADEAEDIGYAIGIIGVSLVGLNIAGSVAVGVNALSTAIRNFPGVKTLLGLFNVGWASSNLVGLPGFFESLAGALMIGAQAFGGPGTPAFDIIGGKIIDGINEFVRKNFGEKVLDALGEGLLIVSVAGFGFLIGGFPGAIAGAIIGAILDAIQGGDLITSFWEQIRQDLFNWDVTSEFWDYAKQCFANALDPESFADFAVNIVEGFVNGFATAVGLVLEPIVDLFYTIGKGIKDTFGIASPAKEMMPYGEYILLGIIEGFRNTFQNWTGALNEWFDSYISPWFTKQKWSDLYNTIKETLEITWNDTVGNWRTNITKWWNEDVKSWFEDSDWMKLYSVVKDKLKETWDSTWETWKTSLSNWWNEDVLSWFEEDDWMNTYKTIKESLSSTWNKTCEEWKTNIKTWWDNEVAPKFKLETWTGMMSGIPTAFGQVFKEAVKNAVSKLNDLIDWVNKHLKISIPGLDNPITGEEMFPGFEYQLFKLPHIPELAEGGLVSSGQLFIANEAGPELVGKHGSKTGVMNNAQIVDAVSEGVAIAVANVIADSQKTDSGQKIEVNLVVDGRTLAKVLTDTQRRSGYRMRLT